MVPSSTNVFSTPNPFFDNEEDDVHLNYHHQIHNPFICSDFFCHTCPAVVSPVTDDISTIINQDFVLQQQFSEDHNDLLDSVVSSYKKKMETSKNDAHGKICTAHGVRDRRVRLSIDTSRKFFCLQDLLGFDKPSKTLDWLFTKSLTSIKDLLEEKSSCSSSTVTDESKARFLEAIKGDSDDENSRKKKSFLKSVDGKTKKTIQRRKSGSLENLSREKSRAEARARARERTKEKNRVKKLDDCESGCVGKVEMQNDFQETSMKLKDSSFQIKAFHEQLGD